MSAGNPDTVLEPPSVGGAAPVLRAPNSLRAAILSGSMILLVGSGLVSIINLAYNILLARVLGATGFGQAVSVYTLLMVLSAVTLSFQFVCSKFVAKNNSLAAKAAVYSVLHRRSWQAGALVGITLAVASPAISGYLNLNDPMLIVLLGVGTAFYIPLGVRRGLLQGVYEFRRLSINFIVEVVVKLGATIALLALGFGVKGVIAAVSASVVAAYLLASPSPELKVAPETGLPASFFEGVQAIVFFVGQVTINNVDILLVKHFYPAEQAGLYAAIAVVGRVVYMSSWAVVSSMFPLSAGAEHPEPYRRTVVITPLLLVLSIAALSLLGLRLLPNVVWRGLFGASFHLLGTQNGYSSLPLLYVAATSLYCLSVVLITYEMSRKIGSTGWLQLAFSGAIAVGICRFHGSLHQVIMVQLVLMLLLLACVFVPFLRLESVPYSEAMWEPTNAPIVKRRRIDEDEVIAGFLRNEFYHPEFHRYWERLEKIVLAPDFEDAGQNALRRALLFRRRGGMWRELPPDTQWWEVELDPADLARVRVFPRSHWRRSAHGNFALAAIAENIRTRARRGLDGNFLSKVRSLSGHLREENRPTVVLLIGIDETSPLTIIEGNHRMVAAMLLSPHTVCQRFRFVCGFSPRMAECCWYKTDISTLLRYTKNTVRHLYSDRDAALEDMLFRIQQYQVHE